MFDGLGMSMGNLSRLSNAKTRSISAENFTGEPGRGGMATEGAGANAARDLGQGWKVSPSVAIEPGATFTLADIQGPGAVEQIWMTPIKRWNDQILRIYWDGQENPSVEAPISYFFCSGWDNFSQLNSLAICVNTDHGLNCYFEMPFKKRCRITVTNLSDEIAKLYFQINYTLTDIPDDCAYFHAQYRRVNPLPYKQDYTIIDGIEGKGHYVGVYMAWGSNSCGWWGEGEIKFFMDDDKYPTICGTGTEDYFCGACCFRDGDPRSYRTFTTPYSGFHQLIQPDGQYRSQTRFGMYRFHIMDPVRFEKKLKVTMQALGWRSGGRYLPLQDDIASVCYWYQTLPTAPFPAFPSADEVEVK